MQDSIVKEIGEGKPEAAVIWLHGLGADGSDFVPILPDLGLGNLPIRFIFPNAETMPISINNGMVMPAWYDVRSADLTARQDESGMQKSQRRIEAIIASQVALGIDSNHIILVGFSQGGVMALYTGLRHGSTLGGIIALSAYLPLADSTKQQAHQANLGTPILMAHGSSDPLIPIGTGRDSSSTLKKLGYRVDWHEYDMPHSVHPDEIALIGTWIIARLAPLK